MFLNLFSRKGRLARERASGLYTQIVHHARTPVFYTDYAVPDTFDGRFAMMATFGGLLVNRLSRPDAGKDGKILAQAYFDVMFLSLDWSIREMGVGDLGVPRRIKKMMSSFKGIAFAYEEAIAAGEASVRDVLLRNIYADVDAKPSDDVLKEMVQYICACAKNLEQQSFDELWGGKICLPQIENNTKEYSNHAA